MENYKHITQPFEIVIDKDCQVLILGSFPSVKSREVGFYYMNPYNRFWRVLTTLFDDDFVNASIQEKKDKLLNYHLALYDVITECDIIGSSDSSIKNAKYLDLKNILLNSKIRKIYLNGNKAYEVFMKAYPEYARIAYKLPSTSPANAKMRLDDLVAVWKRIWED